MSVQAAPQPVSGAFSMSVTGGVQDLSEPHAGDAHCIQPVTVQICRTDKLSLVKMAQAKGVSTRELAKTLLLGALRTAEKADGADK